MRAATMKLAENAALGPCSRLVGIPGTPAAKIQDATVVITIPPCLGVLGSSRVETAARLASCMSVGTALQLLQSIPSS